MYNSILKRRAFLCAEIEKCRKTIKSAPPGKLEISYNRNATKWFVKPDDGKRNYLPKSETKLASALARKRIETERIVLMEKEKAAIDLYLKHCPSNDALVKSATTQKRFEELLIKAGSEETVKWQDQPFEQNPTFLDNLKFPSPSGHILRSKSECLIDMELFHRKIPFRYECKAIIGGIVLFPDFTIYKERTGEYKYWEHYGMMDDPRYRKKALEKEDLYYSNGLLPGRELIFTFETADKPINMVTIDRIIDEIEEWLMD